MDDSFKKAPLAVPKLSGFDKSHQNLLSAKVGTIVPVLVDELIPGSKVNLKMALAAQLPPLASDTFMRCSIKAEAFFCPARLLDGGYEAWFTDEQKQLIDFDPDSGDYVANTKHAYMPVIGFTTPNTIPSWATSIGSPNTLSDYLGYKSRTYTQLIVTGSGGGISALPFLAYHRIYHDWYRNSLVQKECFLPPRSGANLNASLTLATAPYCYHDGFSYVFDTEDHLKLADGVSVLDLRQRNFGLDYFTSGTPSPQQGSAQKVTFSTSGSTGEFSIAALRAANSMQQFKERNNLLGNLYPEQIFGRYGVRPSDGVAQRSLYLGRGEFEVYSKGIFQATTPFSSDGTQAPNYDTNNNPFSTVGARYGSAYAQGDNFLVNFEAKEHGYLFVMATLVPRVTYSSGIRKYLTHYIGDGSLSDLANPILQNVGPQPIRQRELYGNSSSNGVFAYTDRYAEFKTMEDELHGLLRDGQSLDAFALQRSFASDPTLSSNFLKIPTDYMDQITAVSSWISEFGYWLDTFFDYKVSMPISKYSLPSLQDPAYEHGKTIVVSKGGSKL